jgi:hypothetical protein
LIVPAPRNASIEIRTVEENAMTQRSIMEPNEKARQNEALQFPAQPALREQSFDGNWRSAGRDHDQAARDARASRTEARRPS